MGNCLATVLKATVNDENLVKLNEIKLLVAGVPGSSSLCIVLPSENGKSNITTYDGVFANQQHTRELLRTNSGMFGITADIGKTIINCSVDYKYVITKLQDAYPHDFSDLAYNSVTELGNTTERVTNAIASAINDRSLNIDSLLTWKNTAQLTKIEYSFYGTNCSTKALNGNLSSLAMFTNLTNLTFILTNIKGDLKDIGSLTSLEILNVSQSGGIFGSLEDFVRRQSIAGRTTESTGVSITPNGNITFNEVASLTRGTLTWEPNNLDVSKIDVTFGGVEITIDK